MPMSRATHKSRMSEPVPLGVARASAFGRSFLSILDVTPADLEQHLALAARLKRERRAGADAPTAHALAGIHVALLFEKPSLRTKATFEIAIHELGGRFIEPATDTVLGSREALADVARSLERWVAAAVIRTFEQERLREFAAAAKRLSIINALSNEEHPCQALADCLTLKEHWGALAGRTLAFIGDGNNVAASVTQAAVMMGINVRVASPDGFALPSGVVDSAARVARHGAGLRLFRSPREAVTGADAVYTDVWTSMGKEAEADRRRVAFAAYQVNAELMSHARPGALFMHCLPAHRGEEVTDEVIDGPASVVFDQAENRLHTQKALLLTLLGTGR